MPSANDFTLPVENIGTFTFGKRTMRDQVAIAVEYGRLTEGAADLMEEETTIFCRALAQLKVMTVQGPDGWNPDNLDPFDPDSYAAVLKVWGALRDKEVTFRPGAQSGGTGAGPGSGGDGGVLVPPQVPAPAN